MNTNASHRFRPEDQAERDRIQLLLNERLICACMDGSSKGALRQIELGARAVELEAGAGTLLHVVAGHGMVDVAKAILDQGVPIDAVNPYGQTALHMACSSGHDEMIGLLLDHGADVGVVDEKNCIPLHDVFDRCSIDLVRRMCEMGANVNARNDKLETPLHTAARLNRTNILLFLLCMGADQEAENSRGQTPLEVCMAHRNFHTTEDRESPLALIAHGANATVLDEARDPIFHAMPAMHAAARGGYVQRVFDLLNMGHDAEALHRGFTAEDDARSKGQQDVVAAFSAWRAQRAVDGILGVSGVFGLDHRVSEDGKRPASAMPKVTP